jgi:hypothetical protein
VTEKVKRTKRPSHRYSDEFQRKIAKEFLSGQASYGVLAEEPIEAHRCTGALKKHWKSFAGKRQVRTAKANEVFEAAS